MSLTAGARLGPYEILGALGAGGMGEVYRARDTKLNRDVAIKVLPDVFVADPERGARFAREAQLLAALNHPHIAQVFGLEERSDPDGRAVSYIVLEFVDGQSLAQKLDAAKGAGLGVHESLRIARQIVDAVEAAHEKGIVHRDLKPANIMLTADGQVKVLDFGLAKHDGGPGAPAGPGGLSHSPTLTFAGTLAGMILGTATYMAPEQAKGRDADKRCDVWAFGCVLFEMLAGRRAFDGEDVTEVDRGHCACRAGLGRIACRHAASRACDRQALPREGSEGADSGYLRGPVPDERGVEPDQPRESRIPAPRSASPPGGARCHGRLQSPQRSSPQCCCSTARSPARDAP